MKKYVGIAIKQNCSNLLEMRIVVTATQRYVTVKLINQKIYLICIVGRIVRKENIVGVSDSCQTKKQVKKTCKQKVNLVVAIMKEIKSIFQDLADTEMLEKNCI